MKNIDYIMLYSVLVLVLVKCPRVFKKTIINKIIHFTYMHNSVIMTFFCSL